MSLDVTRTVRFGLWPKLALLLAVAVVVAAAVPAWLSYDQSRRTVGEALVHRAMAVGRAASSNASFCISGGETECQQLTNALRALDDVAWVAVIDAQGIVPTGGSTFAAALGARGLEAVRYRRAAPPGVHRRTVHHGGQQYLSVIVPVEAPPAAAALDLLVGGGDAAAPVGPIGVLEVGFSLTKRDRDIRAALWRNVWVAGVVVLISLVLGSLFARLLTTPLLRIAMLSDTMARGDLRATIEVRSSDEIGLLSEAFNTMVASMRSALDRIKGASERIDRAAAELVDLMSAQSAGAGENLATVSATTASIGEILAGSAEARQRGRAAIDLAQRAITGSEQLTASGQRALDDAVAELERMRSHLATLVARVHELESRSDPLGRVMEVGSQMADRLHELSISASQEAVAFDRDPTERGKSTMGTVIGELRSQAREAQRAAAVSRRTVAEVHQSIRRLSGAADEGARAVEASGARTRHVATTIEQRGSVARDSARASRQIADLIQEQLEGMEQIFRAVEHVRRGTSQFSVAADQTLSTAKALTRLSAEMKQILSGYRLR